MKLFCSILAIIILVLSCIPCSDAEIIAVQNNMNHETTKTNTEHSRPSDQDHKDLCSPFCQCSCCAIAYTIPVLQVHTIVIKPNFTEKAFAAYLQQTPIGVTLPVWQPPKIATSC